MGKTLVDVFLSALENVHRCIVSRPLGRRHLRLQHCIADPLLSRYEKCVSHWRERKKSTKLIGHREE